MKKILCVLLSVIMMLSGVSVVALAAENTEDRYVVDDLILESVLDEESYYHLRYTRDNGYFDSVRALYSALNLYDDGIYNGITGSNDYKVATATMLGLVERVEVAYNGEIMAAILEVLGTATDAMDIVDKVNDVIKIFDFVNSEGWGETYKVLIELQKYLKYGEDLYKEYLNAVSEILTCKAAGQYYQELLDFIGANCRSQIIRNAANELSAKIDGEIDRAFGAVALKVTEDFAKYGINWAINELSSLNTVTAILSKIYGAIGDIAQFLFNTKEQHEYMTALMTLVSIEDILPDYVEDKVMNTSEESGEFAFTSLLKLRQSGEQMLLNLEKVKRDSIAGSIFNGYHMPEIIERSATQVAKLGVLQNVINEDVKYPVSAIIATAAPVTLSFYDDNKNLVGVCSNTEADVAYGPNGCFASVYNEIYGGLIKVAFTFGDNCDKALYEADGSCYLTLACETFTKGGFYDVFYMQNIYLNADRYIRYFCKDWTTVEPYYEIIDLAQKSDTEDGVYEKYMVTDYDSENEGMVYENDVDKGQIDKEEPKDEPLVNADGLWAVIVAFFTDLFKQIEDFFNNLFK